MKGSLLDTVRPFRSRRPIFVSFASDSDSANAEFAVRLLESKGFECTFLHAPDKRLRPPPGIADEADWISKRLRALISEASCVVSIASTSSFERPFVLDEFVTALRRAEQVFILWLDPKSPPTGVRGIAHKYNRWLPMPQVWEIDFTHDPVRRLDEFLEANPLFGRSVQDYTDLICGIVAIAGSTLVALLSASFLRAEANHMLRFPLVWMSVRRVFVRSASRRCGPRGA